MQIIFLKNLFESMRNIIGIERLSVGPYVHGNMQRERNPNPFIELLLLRHQFFKVAFRTGNHTEDPIAAFTFCLIALVQRGHLCDGVLDMNGS